MRCIVSITLLLAVCTACNTSDVSRAVGAICDSNDECDERCLLPSPEFPDGFCTISCDDHSDCVGGAACVDIDGGVCLFECQFDDNCEFLGESWTCQAKSARVGDEVMVCHGNT